MNYKTILEYHDVGVNDLTSRSWKRDRELFSTLAAKYDTLPLHMKENLAEIFNYFSQDKFPTAENIKKFIGLQGLSVKLHRTMSDADYVLSYKGYKVGGIESHGPNAITVSIDGFFVKCALTDEKAAENVRANVLAKYTEIFAKVLSKDERRLLLQTSEELAELGAYFSQTSDEVVMLHRYGNAGEPYRYYSVAMTKENGVYVITCKPQHEAQRRTPRILKYKTFDEAQKRFFELVRERATTT